MQALPASGVKATVSLPPSYLGIPRIILGSAAAQPHQPRGEDGAHLTQVRREVAVDRVRQGHRDPARIVLPILYRLATRTFSAGRLGGGPCTAVSADGRPTFGFTVGQIRLRRALIELSQGTLSGPN